MNRPLMKKPGVPFAPTCAASAWSLRMRSSCFGSFREACHLAMSRSRSLAMPSRSLSESAPFFAKRASWNCQNLPCSPAASAARADGFACSWNESGLCFITTRSFEPNCSSSAFTFAAAWMQYGHW